jgi:hypothetical protein
MEHPMDHISLGDPITWVGILVAAFLIAGLRWLVRGGPRRPSSPDEDGGER